MGHFEFPEESTSPRRTFRPLGRVLKWVTSITIFLVLAASYNNGLQGLKSTASSLSDLSTSAWEICIGSKTCQPAPPNLFAYSPPRPSNEIIVKTSKDVEKYLSNRVSKADIDSIAVSIVTPAGPLFEAGYGVLKANETDSEEAQPVDRDSIYRIASISKMFTVLQTLILRERGVLNWDDPVEKYLPDFNPPGLGWASYMNGMAAITEEKPRITLRQLASHLSGIGRDFPPFETEEWPVSTIPPERTTESSYQAILKAVNKYPLVNIPYGYPIYSNTGISLLGLANVAANMLASPVTADVPQTHDELIKRDIFDPLHMNSSFFRVPNDKKLRRHIAVPSVRPTWADTSIGEMNDPAGGQYSSLGDLAKVMQTIVSPVGRGGVISGNVVREWLRPLHSFSSVSEEVGAPWEIMPSLSKAKAYTKGGNLPGYHSEFAVIPEYSTGIIVLVTGEYSDTRAILKEVAKRFIPTLEKLHQADIKKRYVGTWVNGDDVAEVELKNGALMLKKLFIRGVDVLKVVSDAMTTQSTGETDQQMAGAPSVALWSTGRTGEFRLAFGRPNLNKVNDVGCMPYWISMDIALHSRGAPIDLVYWSRGVLTYPSSGVTFSRKT